MSSSCDPVRSGPLALLAGTSLVVLALEVLLTRLLSYALHALLVYVVLGLAMLGFGAAGSLVAVRRRWLDPDRVGVALAGAALAFAVSLLAGYAVFVRIAPRLVDGLGWTLLGSGLLTLPLMSAGVVVTLALSSAGARPGRVYAANLVGSGLGSLLPLALLGPLSGPQLLAVLVASAGLLAVGYARSAGLGWRTPLGAAALVTTTLGVLTLPLAERVLPITPDSLGQAQKIQKYCDEQGIEMETVFDRWNPVGRIEIFAYSGVPGGPEPYPFRFYAQDNTAGALMVEWDGRGRETLGADVAKSNVGRLCTETLYGQAHFKTRRRVMVIGVGGATDVQCALFNGAQEVDAVEINPDAVAAIRGPLDGFLGGIGSDSRVRYHVLDGRSFAHGRRRADYDLVTLSGADTKALGASGALALEENVLHTREAFRDYLQNLTPDGVLAIIRFGEPEALRLALTAVAALRDVGAKRPQHHIVIVQNGIAYGVLVRRQPFPAAERVALHRWLLDEQKPFEGLDVAFLRPIAFLPPTRPVLMYPGEERALRFVELFEQVERGDTTDIMTRYIFDITPTTDDRPFFFDHARYDRFDGWGHQHVRVLVELTAVIIALALVLILAPLGSLRGRLRAGPGALSAILFACLGFGYLAIEIWLLHRFATYLGHQTYSMSIVLALLLVGTGVGATFGERLVPAPNRRIVRGILTVLGLLAVGVLALHPLLEATWGLPFAARAALAGVYVLPLGFFLGFPFPAGLQWLGKNAAAAVPWCVGINAFASVVASVTSITIAHVGGYSAVLQVGGLLYAAALLVSAQLREAPA